MVEKYLKKCYIKHIQKRETDMIEWLQGLEKWQMILIIIAFVLVALWLLALIVSIAFSLVFNGKVKNSSNAINVLLTQRYEIMKYFIKIAENHGVSVPSDYIKAVEKLERISDFQKLKKEDRDERVLSFLQTSNKIISLCDHSKEVFNDPLYQDKVIEFNDTEEIYRQKSSQYNDDVIGYNYWISIFLVKFIYRMFGIRKKDLII
jgi:hypothetical protein